jgi:hypothetical protein
MKDQYKILAANARKIAINYENKAIAFSAEGGHNESDEMKKLADHHRNEATKYMQAAEAL